MIRFLLNALILLALLAVAILAYVFCRIAGITGRKKERKDFEDAIWTSDKK